MKRIIAATVLAFAGPLIPSALADSASDRIAAKEREITEYRRTMEDAKEEIANFEKNPLDGSGAEDRTIFKAIIEASQDKISELAEEIEELKIEEAKKASSRAPSSDSNQ